MVTGGAGFIGTNLAQELLEQGADVTILDLPTGVDWHRLPGKVSHIKADIMDKKALKGKLDGFDIIYHLAARTDLEGITLPDYAVNFTGTQNIIEESCRQKRPERFVFYSTQLVTGVFNETRFLDESEPYKTKTPYGQSKIEGEKVVQKYCAEFDVPFTTIRPTSVYGPWGKEPYKSFFSAIKKGRYFHIGRADNLVSLVFVKNLVDQTILLSLHTGAKDQTFYGTDFHPYTMREVVNAVSGYYGRKIITIPSLAATVLAYGLGAIKLLGANVPLYPFRLRNMKANYCYDIQKSVRLGYDPQYDLMQGVKETLDWYESKKVL